MQLRPLPPSSPKTKAKYVTTHPQSNPREILVKTRIPTNRQKASGTGELHAALRPAVFQPGTMASDVALPRSEQASASAAHGVD